MLPLITVCISTFRRPALLALLLHKLTELQGTDAFRVRLVVADNDPDRSAEPVVRDFVQRHAHGVVYCHEPERNIALARNAAVARAEGDYVAFIDDDEYPDPHWLRQLYEQCAGNPAIAGALGPVVPYFAQGEPPPWVARGRFFDRPRHPSGTLLRARDCRTGNALVTMTAVSSLQPVFDPRFGTGGEDIDFFERLIHAGHAFVWCDEAVVHEQVPPSRCSRRYLLRRALAQGRISVHNRDARRLRSMKCVLAVPLYSLCLPVALLFGQHRSLQLTIKLCHHLGRAQALLGRRPLRERRL